MRRYLCISGSDPIPTARTRGAFAGLSALVLLSLVLGSRAVPMAVVADGGRDAAVVRDLPGQFVKAVRKIVGGGGEQGHQPALMMTAGCRAVDAGLGPVLPRVARVASVRVALRCELLDLPPPVTRA